MIPSSFHNDTFLTAPCNEELSTPQPLEYENGFVSPMQFAPVVAESVQKVAVIAQLIQATAATIVETTTDTVNVNISTAVEYPMNDSAVVEYYNEERKDEDDSSLTEADLALLSHVTTAVGGFDPLSEESIQKRPKFIPILEAKGGIDKDEEGHRRDTMPIAKAIDENESLFGKIQTGVFQFLEENAGLSTHCIMTNDTLKKYLKRAADGIIVRINPGTLSPLSTKKCDDMLRELSDAGITILSHPDVMSTLGAKDVSTTHLFFFCYIPIPPGAQL